MDSNSGSMQSSSGGDDQEFDSRGESISSFLNPSPHFGSNISAAPQPPFLAHQNPTFFDPHLSQNFDHHPTQYNNDNDLIWPRGLRSDQPPNYANFGNLTPSSSLPSRTQSIASAGVHGPFPAGPSSSVQLRADAEGQSSRPLPPQPNVIKNPKKRTRASRRAPTTVLTTDTTNFRQMVQEFTGIPSAPFSASPYNSRRLDLFSAASALRSGSHLDSLGPLYPLRPSSHKLLSPFSSSPPSLLNSTMIDSIVPTTNIGSSSNSNNNNNNTNPHNYPLSDDHLMNLQHQSSIPLQPSLGKLQLGANASISFGSLSGFLSRETPSAATAQVRNSDANLSRWKSGETVIRNNDGVEDNLVTFDGNINSRESQQMSGYNLNLAEKGMENVGSSGAEGTVASWICPSD